MGANNALILVDALAVPEVKLSIAPGGPAAFAAAIGVLGRSWLGPALPMLQSRLVFFHLLLLLAFVFILVAIWEKNR